MKTFLPALASAAVLLATLSGCITSPNPPNGLLYSSIEGPNRAIEGKHLANKRGESCASSVLGLVAWGDASIDSARRQAKITDIASVDYANTDVVTFIYSKTCAIVTGS